MARRVKVEISESQYEATIQARADGATKKRQCEILGIAYNTSRLDSLLEEYQEEKVRRAAMVKKMRAKPITPQEKANMVEAYLQGDTMGDMAKQFYRSSAIIKRQLEMAGVWGLRFNESPNPLNPKPVPDECMADSFEIGEKVWVPAYRCLGEVMKLYTNQPDGVDAYRVYLLDEAKHRNIIQKAYDLGSLRHVEELGVDIRSLENNMGVEDMKILMAEALRKARMTAREKK